MPDLKTSCDSFEERKGGNTYVDAYSDMAERSICKE